ncbi:MAG: L-aspartate oxidase [Geitlerinemataceae cyanobacterium]
MNSAPLPDRFDILVIGSGAAGLYTALRLPERLRVGLVTKSRLPKSASDWAQGGIAAAIDPDDAPAFHVADTIAAGAGLCEPEAVRVLAESAPDCVRALVDLGVGFDRCGDRLALTLEAAHSHRRVLHAADTTGRAVVSTLSDRVQQRQNISILDDAFVLDLWLGSGGRCEGAAIARAGRVQWVRAGAVVLATGGGGQVFAKTTNPSVSTGDGVAMAWRSGALLRDLEFFQFHPTALAKADAPSFLISEAVRGEGAHLIDDTGHRFVFDDHPKGELAPRDVVSRSIYRYLNDRVDDPATACVWLDLGPIGRDRVRARFPNIIRKCQKWGIDILIDRVPVSPAAHYWMGGVQTGVTGSTSIAGLYAVGETASTGVHGANRLASNSLLECLVFGAKLAEVHFQTEGNGISVAPPTEPGDCDLDWAAIPESEWQWLAELRDELPRLLWRSAGICREAASLDAALAEISQWRSRWQALKVTQILTELTPGQPQLLVLPADDTVLCSCQIALWGETRNLLDIGELILKSARFREESRGGHFRSDFPDTRDDWRAHTLVEGDRVWRSRPVVRSDST